MYFNIIVICLNIFEQCLYNLLRLEIRIPFLEKHFTYLFLERGKGERQGQKKHQCVVASCALPTGDQAHNPGMCPDWESHRQPFGLQAGTNPLSYTSQG